MRPGRLLVIAVAALLAAGCGGGKGEAGKTTAQILADTEAVTNAAKTVHISGSGSTGGASLKLDLYLVRGTGGRGHVVISGLAFDIVRIGDKAYFRGDASFWSHFGGAGVSQLLAGRWIEASATTGQLASFTPITNLSVILGQVFSGKDALTRGTPVTVGGKKTIALYDAVKKGTLYVAASGKPYPLRIVSGAQGTIDLSGWNEPVELSPPANPIDSSKLPGFK